jgi:hypothetical protein
MLTRHVTENLLHVHAAAGVRGLLAFDAIDSSTHEQTPQEGDSAR